MEETLITAKGSLRAYWRDLWHHKELIIFLSKRDVLVRYQEAFLGLLWALARPLLNTLALCFVFTVLGKGTTFGVPLPLFLLCGMVPWQFFASSLQSASMLVINNNQLISKIWFPRIILSLSSLAVNTLDFIVGLLFFLPLTLYYQTLSWSFLWAFPLALILTFFLALGLTLLAAALSVRFRDLVFVIPFFVQIGMFFAPIIYPLQEVDEGVRQILYFNPVTGIMQLYHLAFLGVWDADVLVGTLSALVGTITLFFLGCLFFKRLETQFADLL